MTATRTMKSYLLLLVKGMAMGAADVVPGVSGGTIALITGIYDELLHSLKQCSPAALAVLVREGMGAFWRYINGNFLVAVFAGILLSIKTIAALISFCLTEYPLLVWAFFTGLILASAVLLIKQQPRWARSQWLALFIGIAVVVAISVARPTQIPVSGWIMFLGGFIAICAMILPGISGSFILLLMGLYPVVLDAVNELNLVLLSSFVCGCIAGLLVFSRVLVWLLDNYHQTTLALLIGFLLGSLNVTWPWKVSSGGAAMGSGEMLPSAQGNVLPFSYNDLTGLDPQIITVAIFAAFGLFLVLLAEFLATKFSGIWIKE